MTSLFIGCQYRPNLLKNRDLFCDSLLKRDCDAERFADRNLSRCLPPGDRGTRPSGRESAFQKADSRPEGREPGRGYALFPTKRNIARYRQTPICQANRLTQNSKKPPDGSGGLFSLWFCLTGAACSAAGSSCSCGWRRYSCAADRGQQPGPQPSPWPCKPYRPRRGCLR